MSDTSHDTPHVPGPSLWPIAFAIGVACLLLGLVISWIVAAIGAVIAVVFGFLWARDVTRDVRDEVPAIEPETRAVADRASATTTRAVATEQSLPAYTRSRFLEASTLGVGAAIGAIITLPVLGFTVLPSFTNLEEDEADLGPIENFPEGEYVIASFLANQSAGRGQPANDVRPEQRPDRRRRAELHDPLQPLRPPRLPGAAERADRRGEHRRRSTGSSCGRCSRSRSAARATAACTTPRATARPARPFARSTA